MDADRASAAGPAESVEPAESSHPAPAAPAPGRHASAHAAATARSARLPAALDLRDESGLALAIGSVLVVGVVGVAASAGWGVLLVVMALGQVVLSRSWVAYLDVPGALPASLSVLAVAAVADLGVVVARLTTSAGDRADRPVQLAPALGVLLLVAIAAQLARGGSRSGALAGLVASTTGGALVVGLALWVPLQASPSGPRAVLIGAAVCGTVGLVVGLVAWVRRVEVPGPALLLPVLLGVASVPVYVVARLHAG